LLNNVKRDGRTVQLMNRDNSPEVQQLAPARDDARSLPGDEPADRLGDSLERRGNSLMLRVLQAVLPVVAVVLILLLDAPAQAEVETFRLEWASVETYVDPALVLGSGAGPVTLQSWLAPGGIPGYRLDALRGVTFFFICPDSVNCTVDGGFTWPYDGTMVVQRLSLNGSPATLATLQLDVRWYGHNNNGQLIAAGIKEVVAPPPPPPPPPASALKVFITQPATAATVSGTVWVTLWVQGTSGASNVFTLSADGKQIGSPTTSSRSGPVTIPWPTKPIGATPVPNGTHTLTGTVRDATGNTGTTSITVIVNN